jgi:hypothetical protein
MIESRLLLKRGDVVEQYGNSQSLKDLSHEFQHGRVERNSPTNARSSAR